jgi:hypothetical protein
MHWEHEPVSRLWERRRLAGETATRRQGCRRSQVHGKSPGDLEFAFRDHEPLADARRMESADKSDALSKRFALPAETRDHAIAFGLRASSAPLSEGSMPRVKASIRLVLVSKQAVWARLPA